MISEKQENNPQCKTQFTSYMKYIKLGVMLGHYLGYLTTFSVNDSPSQSETFLQK